MCGRSFTCFPFPLSHIMPCVQMAALLSCIFNILFKVIFLLLPESDGQNDKNSEQSQVKNSRSLITLLMVAYIFNFSLLFC